MPKLTLTAAGRAQQTLRSIRLELGLNLREASERIGCSISALSKVERSLRSFSFYYAVAVSKAYHIPLDSLALLLYPQSGDESWTPKRKWKSEPRQVPGTKSRAPFVATGTALASALGGEVKLPADLEWFEKYGHEPHCNLMFPATSRTAEDFCDCCASVGAKPNA